jgi:hypothetical protein
MATSRLAMERMLCHGKVGLLWVKTMHRRR